MGMDVTTKGVKITELDGSVRECSTTISFGDPPCEHRNGWYRTIPARFFGRRDVFVCTDCGSVLDPETKRKV